MTVLELDPDELELMGTVFELAAAAAADNPELAAAIETLRDELELRS